MKKNLIISIALFSYILIVAGCNKEDSSQQNAITIGASYGGGIIAYILQPGDPGYNASVQHGLIAAPSDLSTSVPWGCYGSLTGASGTAIGTGRANTDSIVSHCGTGTAAYLCHILTLGGYSDWYLPSIGELSVLNIYPATGDWSSSEADSFSAWSYSFVTGAGANIDKRGPGHVRAVRSF